MSSFSRPVACLWPLLLLFVGTGWGASAAVAGQVSVIPPTAIVVSPRPAPVAPAPAPTPVAPAPVTPSPVTPAPVAPTPTTASAPVPSTAPGAMVRAGTSALPAANEATGEVNENSGTPNHQVSSLSIPAAVVDYPLQTLTSAGLQQAQQWLRATLTAPLTQADRVVLQTLEQNVTQELHSR